MSSSLGTELAMDVRLVIVRGAKGRPTFRMQTDELVIGRQKGCGVRVPSASVSRQHCRLRRIHNSLWVEDLGSANGTLLNGQRLDEEVVVEPGDELTVGPVTFLIEYQVSPRTPAAPARPVLPLHDSDFEMAMPELAEETGHSTARDDSDQPLPVLDADEASQAELASQLGNASDRQMDLPEGDELRALLAQLTDSPPDKKP